MAGWRIVARGRDLHQGARPLDVPLRAVDARGKTIDFRLSAKRDVAAAKAFFRKAFKTQQRRVSRTITIDGYQASHRPVSELCAERRKRWGILPVSQYLNNIVDRITATSSLGPGRCWDSSSSKTPRSPSAESS